MTQRRFVILRHEPGEASARGLHWDMMLEVDKGLRTWAFPAEPAVGISIDVSELPLHRLEYLDYEGPVSGNRGYVGRSNQGTYSTVEESTTRLVVDLEGDTFRGRLELERIDDAQRWTASLT